MPKNLSTLTHRRDLFEFMVQEYARQRGWDEEETLTHTTHYLEKLEQKHQRKEKIKQLLKNKSLMIPKSSISAG